MPTVQQVLEHAAENLRLGNYRLAEENCVAVLSTVHAEPEAWHLRGVAAHLQGRDFDAVAWLERAVRLNPDAPMYHYNLGVVQQALGEQTAAEATYHRVLELDQNSTSASVNLVSVLNKLGRFSDSVTLCEKLIETEPSARHWARLGNARKMLGDITQSVAAYERAAELAPDDAATHSELIFARQYDPSIDDDALFVEHRQWAARFQPATVPDARPMTRNANEPLRIGFVSPDLGNHPVGIFLAPVLERLDRNRFTPCCYSDRTGQDEFNQRLRASAGFWRDTKPLSHDQLAEVIRADEVDIAFDLAGHTDDNRMPVFARRIAPIQISWAGYVGSTGLGAMDYLLCDRFHVPEELESLHCEQPLRMPHAYIPYEPPSYAPQPGPPPCLSTGHVTFGCLNNPCKVNDETIRLFASVMQQLPGSRLIFKYKGFDDSGISHRFAAKFAEHGIAADRLDFRGGTTHVDHLQTFCEVDISLDPTPYSGGLTTCESLWMGVPVVTWPRGRFASRHTLSHSSNAGFTDGVATSFDDFVNVTVGLASDVDRLSDIRTSLRPMMAASPLCDLESFATAFQELLDSVAGRR
ncbi:MAG: O-linked N-acetylglucosamine transferase, SPINDLY family protein [Planctomycetota bacterium]|jgi:predicted O-linked N-acetylglucosamine transferase (SPINDLY family)